MLPLLLALVQTGDVSDYSSTRNGAPEFDPRRYVEDWRDVEAGDAWWAPYKDMRLDDAGFWRLSLGLELRAQYERLDGDSLEAAPEGRRDYTWWRALPSIDLHAGSSWRLFAQGVAAFETGENDPPTPVDENRADFAQAFVEWDAPGQEQWLSIRAGRQLLAYGSQRLISTRYGPNVQRPFEGAVVEVRRGPWRVDALWSRPVATTAGEFDDSANDDESLWGVYATRELGPGGLDLYYLGHRDDDAVYAQGAGREERHTLGIRWFGERGPLDWNFELFGQVGDFGDAEVRAWSIASDTGWHFEDLPGRPHLGLRANVISGDDDPDDDELGTFDPLYPNGRYFGEIGLIGPYNLINLHPHLSIEPVEDWSVELGAVAYWRESLEDGIYDNPGFVVQAPGGSDERYVGTQFDLALIHRPAPDWTLGVVVSHLEAGPFLEDVGSGEDVQFLQLVAQFDF